MAGLLSGVLPSKVGPFLLLKVPGADFQRRPGRRSARMVGMRHPFRAVLAGLSVVAAVACGSRHAELVPPVAEPALVDPDSPFPKIRFADGLVSVNDRCPVTKRKLSVHFPPVYVNGQPIGFC
jgi:hypothetical protein